MTTKEVSKKDVECLLKAEITDAQFENALERAKRKQLYIFNNNGDNNVMSDWYLLQLVEEAVRATAFEQFTFELCKALKMEKEHSEKTPSTPKASHIITCLAE